MKIYITSALFFLLGLFLGVNIDPNAARGVASTSIGRKPTIDEIIEVNKKVEDLGFMKYYVVPSDDGYHLYWHGNEASKRIDEAMFFVEKFFKDEDENKTRGQDN